MILWVRSSAAELKIINLCMRGFESLWTLIEMKKSYFTKKLNDLAYDFWTEVEKNFILHDQISIEILHEKQTKLGKSITSEIKSANECIVLDDLRFKFGCDKEFALDAYSQNASIVVPHTKNMMAISKQFLKNSDEYISVVLAKLKLMKINSLLDKRKGKTDPFWRTIIAGPHVSDDCATKGGGSVDFVYYVLHFRYFKEDEGD